MYLRKKKGPRVVTLPNGETLSRADLPDAATRRWVARRKWLVVSAVQHDLLSRDEVKAIYGVSDEEFEGWVTAVARAGREGLKVARTAQVRAHARGVEH